MILQGFIYMVLGMATVFAFLVVLALAVSATSRLLGKPAAAHQNGEGVAVALAAVSAFQTRAIEG